MDQDQERERLRAEIETQYGTVHRFCRRCPQLNRATVYMVLNGNYPGNTAGQMKRIRVALLGESKSESVFKAIKNEACHRCSKTGECHQCDRLFNAQAAAVLKIFSN